MSYSLNFLPIVFVAHTNIAEKESEARTKLEALKIQMQLIAEYGRRLLEIAV